MTFPRREKIKHKRNIKEVNFHWRRLIVRGDFSSKKFFRGVIFITIPSNMFIDFWRSAAPNHIDSRSSFQSCQNVNQFLCKFIDSKIKRRFIETSTARGGAFAMNAFKPQMNLYQFGEANAPADILGLFYWCVVLYFISDINFVVFSFFPKQ